MDVVARTTRNDGTTPDHRVGGAYGLPSTGTSGRVDTWSAGIVPIGSPLPVTKPRTEVDEWTSSS